MWGRAPRPSEQSATSQSKPCAPSGDRAPAEARDAATQPRPMQPRSMKTKRIETRRFWIEIMGLAAGAACALALLLACLGAVAAVASDHKPPQPPSQPIQEGQPQNQEAQPQSRQPPQHTYTGMVTCSQCEARHPAASAKTAADCTRTCVRSGAQFALVAGDRTYRLNGDVAPLQKLAGQRATIVGAVSGNTITISSAAAAI